MIRTDRNCEIFWFWVRGGDLRALCGARYSMGSIKVLPTRPTNSESFDFAECANVPKHMLRKPPTNSYYYDLNIALLPTFTLSISWSTHADSWFKHTQDPLLVFCFVVCYSSFSRHTAHDEHLAVIWLFKSCGSFKLFDSIPILELFVLCGFRESVLPEGLPT